MKTIIKLILLVFVSNKIFLGNNENNAKFKDIILQNSEQSLANQAKIYADDIVEIVNNITGNIMEYFQIKINDELYNISSTKAYPHFINTLSKKSYVHFITEVEKYLTKFFSNFKEYNYSNIIEYMIEEQKNFIKVFCETKYKEKIEKIFNRTKVDLQNMNLSDVRNNLYKFANKTNNLDVEKMVYSIKRLIDDFKRQYKNYDDSSKLRLEAEINNEIGFFKTQYRYGISYVNHIIKSNIELFKIYVNNGKFLDDIEKNLVLFYEEVLPILQEIEADKIISIIKYILSTVNRVLKSKTMSEIKVLIRKIIIDNKTEYILDELLLKIYDVIETILNMKFFEEQNVEKICNKLTEILNWAVENLKKIKTFDDLKNEFYNNYEDVFKNIKEYDIHHVFDINAKYARRILVFVVNYIRLGFSFFINTYKTIDSI